MHQISRDAFGIPHITADSIEDLFFGQGFATAQDRPWHLEYDRRRALGTLAAITGSPVHAIADSFARRARIAEAARGGFARLDDATRQICDAHAAGVNAALATGPLSAAFRRFDAPRPEPFEGWQVLATFIVRHLNFATWQKKLWNARVVAALGPQGLGHFHLGRQAVPLIVPSGVTEMVAAVDPTALPDGWNEALEPLGLSLSGSNCWAVSAVRSATGHPLIAGDPHRSLEAPNVYYQVGLSCLSAGIDAAGIAFPGVPGIAHFGQNAHVAWGVTNAMADYQDLYIERLADTGTVLDHRVEVVEVRGHDALTVECMVTRHGPVVVGSSEIGIGLALAAAELTHAGGSLTAVLPQLQATSVADLDAALAPWVEPVNNFVLADRESIAYRTAGRVPVRTPINAWLPVPGWVTDHDWQAAIADVALPRERDPAAGFVVTANQQIVGAESPHLIHVNPDSPDRAMRIWDHLRGRSDLTIDDQSAIHRDTIHRGAARFAQLAGGRLTAWDGSMTSDSTEAALFALAESVLTRRLAAALVPALHINTFAAWEPAATAASAIDKVGGYLHEWIAANNTWLLPSGETWAQACQSALAEAEATLNGRTWGDIHRLRPLSLGSSQRLTLGPVSGADGCVMATMHVAGISTDALLGSTARYVWDLADRRNSGWIVPLGASEFDDSPHFSDQTQRYIAGDLIPAFSQLPSAA